MVVDKTGLTDSMYVCINISTSLCHTFHMSYFFLLKSLFINRVLFHTFHINTYYKCENNTFKVRYISTDIERVRHVLGRHRQTPLIYIWACRVRHRQTPDTVVSVGAGLTSSLWIAFTVRFQQVNKINKRRLCGSHWPAVATDTTKYCFREYFFFWGPAGKIIRMTNSAHGGNVGGKQCQTFTD